MKNALLKTVPYVMTLALAITLVSQSGFVLAANADAPAASAPANWQDVSSAFTKQIGAQEVDPSYLRRCIGLIVTPDGDIFMQTANKGVCVSRDQGATWAVVADNKIAGRCEHGFGFSIAYPYDGRMVFFCYDGNGTNSGGISLDDAKTWKPFSQLARGTEFGDVDWSTPDPQTIFAITHEPYFSILSNDAGKSWQRLDKSETGGGSEVHYCPGIIDGKTLVRGTKSTFAWGSGMPAPGTKQGGVIELSKDAGQTWTQVANYQVVGRRPVHYGRNVYWTTSDGVIVSSNGKDWTLIGPGAEGACYGPYFGASDQEFVVVSNTNFLKTEDGGKTWKPIAKLYVPPDIFHGNPWYEYFGWDAKHNILYASGLGAAVYQLKL
jgi:hypothetical protein